MGKEAARKRLGTTEYMKGEVVMTGGGADFGRRKERDTREAGYYIWIHSVYFPYYYLYNTVYKALAQY